VDSFPVGLVEDEVHPNLAMMTGDQISALMDRADIYIDYFKSIKEEVYNRWENNRDPATGWKVVKGRASKKWGVDDAKISDTMVKALNAKNEPEELRFKPEELRTPAQMTKLVKEIGLDKSLLDGLIITSYGKTLARVEDKRPALPGGADAMFTAEEEE